MVSTSTALKFPFFPSKHHDANALLISIRLSAKYRFQKPNDRAALELMNAAAVAVMKELTDVNIAYGISDEFRSSLLHILEKDQIQMLRKRI